MSWRLECLGKYRGVCCFGAHGSSVEYFSSAEGRHSLCANIEFWTAGSFLVLLFGVFCPLGKELDSEPRVAGAESEDVRLEIKYPSPGASDLVEAFWDSIALIIIGTLCRLLLCSMLVVVISVSDKITDSDFRRPSESAFVVLCLLSPRHFISLDIWRNPMETSGDLWIVKRRIVKGRKKYFTLL